MRSTLFVLLCAMNFIISCTGKTTPDRVVIAYIGSAGDLLPDPSLVTHVNYAFGEVNETFDGIIIQNPDHLKAVAAIKKESPDFKVLLSIGGWESGRFSEMAASDIFRNAFAADCRRVMDEYNLDGIDIDWEFPTSSMSGISSSPDDIRNFNLLMRDIRKAIGKNGLLTIAAPGCTDYYDFPAFVDYLDFVNVMTYDMAFGAYPHNALYTSSLVRDATSASAVDILLGAGVPADKLVMGIPFYGRGVKEYGEFISYRKIYPIKDGFEERWDDDAKVPYIVDSEGAFVFGFENIESAGLKCGYIIEKGIRGAMYWEYNYDSPDLQLSTVIAEEILGK